MITTVTDMYEELLFAIKKENIDSIYPDEASSIFNTAAILYLKDNAKMIDLNQKQQDDLKDFFTDLQVTLITNTFDLSTLTRYFRLNRVMVKISNTDPCINNTEWQEVRHMKSDMVSVIRKSSYRKPGVTKLYYRIEKSELKIEGGTVTDWWINYLSYFPNVDIQTTPLLDVSNFSQHVLHEIIDIAARVYIEGIESPRYRSILQEEQIKSRSND